MQKIASAVVGGCLAYAVISTTNAAGQHPQWRTIEGTSRIDGTRQVVLFLDGDEGAPADTAKQARPMLFLRCSENVTSLFVDVSPLYVSGSVPVSWRIDGEKPVSGTWWAAASNGGIGPWKGGQTIRFIKSLVDRKTLQLKFSPQERHPIEVAFNITDLKAAVGPLREGCGW